MSKTLTLSGGLALVLAAATVHGAEFNAYNDRGAIPEVTPAISQPAGGQLNANNDAGVTPEVTPAKSERAIAGFNDANDRG